MSYKKTLFGATAVLLVSGFFLFKWEKAADRVANEVAAIKSPALPTRSTGTTNALRGSEGGAADFANTSLKQKPFAGSLPPSNLPLTKIVDLLKKESDAGNYRASCRLGLELNRCELLPRLVKEVSKLQQSLTSLENGSEKYLDTVKRIEVSQEVTVADSQICDGFTNPDKLEAWRFDFTAALQGHIASKAQFAIMPPLNPVEFYKNLDGWAAYREYAPQFLLEAANVGNNKAIRSLARAYAGEQSLPGLGNLGGVELAKPDLYQAAVYSYSLFKYDGESETRNSAPRYLKKVEQQLTPEKIAAAKAEGTVLRAKWATSAAVTGENAANTKENRGFDKICDEP